MRADIDKTSRKANLVNKLNISVMVPVGGYLSTAFAGTFFAALSFFYGFQVIGALILFSSLVVIPILAATDRVVFNGKRIYRSGHLAKAWAYLTGTRFWLKPGDIEQVETVVTPAFRRGGRVHLRYATSIRGKGVDLFLTSRGDSYRELVTSLFAKLPEEVLDSASIELRDHALGAAHSRALARSSDIPSADVLEHSLRTALLSRNRTRPVPRRAVEADPERAAGLHKLGNELRISGAFIQAVESFRRAALIQPDNGWLLLDFAQCIRSLAGVHRDDRLERRATAMLRLAERRAGVDGDLLARVGEAYSQSGEWERARSAFEKAMSVAGEHYRSIRGMAEVALRDGKMAHVVHNLRAASGLARSTAARRWSEAEAEYFSRLSTDDEYLEVELGRVNLLHALRRWERTTLRLGIAGLPLIGLGVYYNDAATTNCGWLLSAGMIALWTAIRLGRRLFTDRISPELLDE